MGTELQTVSRIIENLRQDVPTSVIGTRAFNAVSLGRIVDNQGIGEKLRYGGDQEIVIFGPNGKGKGTRVLMPNLLTIMNTSIVVIDPKGELAAVTAPFRRALGRVVIINPFGVLTNIPGYQDLESTGFNPLATLDPASPSFNAKASQIADAIVPIEGKDPHWSQSARALVAMCIMEAVVEARAWGRVPTMTRVRDLICDPSEEAHKGNNWEGVGIPKRALELSRSKIAGLRNKAAQFVEWTNETRSIASTARIQTESFDDHEIAVDLERNGFNFADLKKEPVTVYLILPPDMMERHSKWLRLVVTSAIQSVLRVRRPGEPKTIFMLDEFFSLGHLEILSTVWSLVRGYGVQMMPILQDLNQLKKLYPDMWETFVGMAGVVLSFSPNDLTTAEWLSRRAGETTRMITTFSHSHNSGGSSGSGSGPGGLSSNSGSSWSDSDSTSRSPQKTTLLSGHRLFGLKPGFGVLSLDGTSNIAPIYAPPYYDIRQQWLVARDNPYFLG